MKRWVKKTLTYGIVTGIIAGAIAAGVVLTKPLEINKRNYYQVFNANFSNPPYNFDQSASYGYNVSATMTNTTVPMFRQQSVGTAQFNASEGTVIQPTYSFYTMTYANSITVYNNKGQSFTFTSQASNISMTNFVGSTQKFTPLSNSDLYTNLSFNSNTNPDLSIPTKENPSPAVQWIVSKNDQSINSINFKNWMTPGGLGTGINPTRISIQIKPNLFWSNDQGQKTSYQVVPADFYYSFMRTWLLSPLHRYTSNNPGNGIGNEGGGSAKIDSAIMSKYSISTRFGPNNTYPNGYVFTNENISMNDLLNESLTLKDNAFNVYAENGTSSQSPAQFYSMFQNQMTNNATFSAAPSQYIQHLNTTQSYIDECNTYGITGLSKKFDIYFYGLNAGSTLFGGSYIPTTINPNLSTIIWTKNPNYPNEEFLESKNTINKITWVYNASTNASIFTQNLFSQYLKGNVSTMTYSTLNTTQKNQALEQNLVRPNITQLNNSLLIRTVPVTAPAPDGINSNGTSNYTYNNAYAKLVYGATLDQLSKGEMNAAANENFFAGLGMQFRSLIHAAVNWYTYGWVSSNSNDIPWVSGFAPDASIGGINQATSTNKTLREAWRNSQNSSTTQDSGPNNIYAWNGQQIIGQNTYYSNESWFNSHFSNLNNQFRTPLFSQIQTAITTIINKFYQTNPSFKGQKISWKLAYGYPQAPTVAIQTAYDGVCDAINALNPNLDVQFVPLTTVNALEGAIIDGFGTSQLAGWGYDYDGIGTAFDAMLTQFQSCTALPAFSIFAKLAPNSPLATNFPEFYKLSIFLESWATSPTIAKQLAIPFSQWASMNNAVRQNLQQSISQSINALLANAFLDFQNTCTNEQLISLTQEYNTIIGNSMEMSGKNSLTIPSGFFTFQLVQKWYSNPVIQLGFLYTEDVYVNLENS